MKTNFMEECRSIIDEFAWCQNEQQKVGAMAAEIRHLRARIENLHRDIRRMIEKYNKKE